MQDWCESETEYIVREAKALYRKPAVLWSGGKDSTLLLHVIRQSFGNVPFPVIFLDSGFEFTETKQLIENLAAAWDLDLVRIQNPEATNGYFRKTPSNDCCTKFKIEALKKAVQELGLDAVMVGIRWNEHGVRGKEIAFSPRKDPEHTRIHPLLHWSEQDVRDYIEKNHVPQNSLYSQVIGDGLAYRSVGCYRCTFPTPAHFSEREGRDQLKESAMEELRSMGYM